MESSAVPEKENYRPLKRYFRQRAHCNPLSHNDTFTYPETPDDMDWSTYYPRYFDEKLTPREQNAMAEKQVSVLDVGCGYGGLSVALSSLLPDELILGLEIRMKVTEYVDLRIKNLREENPGQYENVSVMRTNAMKYLANFIRKGQLNKMFFCFPDPHFKEKNHRRRIISQVLLSEYMYYLKEGGILYTITDVEDLANWHRSQLEEHPGFELLSEEELKDDPVVDAVYHSTEEGKKVERNHGKKYLYAARRKRD
ncbi:hypothetical protein WA588_001148, partial [Blastocystis sp. NMH]